MVTYFPHSLIFDSYEINIAYQFNQRDKMLIFKARSTKLPLGAKPLLAQYTCTCI